jgi:hypothetical protein
VANRNNANVDSYKWGAELTDCILDDTSEQMVSTAIKVNFEQGLNLHWGQWAPSSHKLGEYMLSLRAFRIKMCNLAVQKLFEVSKASKTSKPAQNLQY